jgi:hypothetical protein
MENNGKRVVVMHESREVTFVTPSGDELGSVYVNVEDEELVVFNKYSLADTFIKDVILSKFKGSSSNEVKVAGVFNKYREFVFKLPSYYVFPQANARELTDEVLEKLDGLGYIVEIEERALVIPNATVDVFIKKG